MTKAKKREDYSTCNTTSNTDDNMAVSPYPWQMTSWERLIEQYKTKHMSHAYLLSGSKGIGKYYFACMFARYLLCNNPIDNCACNKCTGCLLTQSRTHPDWLDIEPEEAGKEIKIDQIRQLIDFSLQTSSQSGYRIIIIHPAEMMNNNAANALLKALEEPGRKTLLLLACHQVARLLFTIKSRCQLITFTNPSYDDALNWLSQEFTDTTPIPEYLILAGNRPLIAKDWLIKGYTNQLLQIKTDITALTKGQKATVEIAFEWLNFDMEFILKCMTGWVSDMAIYKTTQNNNIFINNSIEKMLIYITNKNTCKDLLNFHLWLIEKYRATCTTLNINKQMLLETLLGKWLTLSI